MSADLPIPQDNATFQITGPGGETFHVQGPGSFQDALGVLGIKPPRPDYESPEFDKAIAQKHGVSPEYVARQKMIEPASEMLEGIPIAGAYVRQGGAALGAGSPWRDEDVSAPGETFSGRYEKNLAAQREIGEAYREAHPVASTAERLAGGAGALGPLGMTGVGARALGITGGSLGTRVAASGASGATIGGLDAAARGGSPTLGAVLGGALGVGVPVAGAVIHSAYTPIASNIAARINPQTFAERQVARAIMESQQTPQQIEAALQQARNEGQPMFTPADAMGNAGQRMLSSVTRAPGEGRTEAVNFLEARQADQGRRIANQLAEGFDSPRTAARVEEQMTAARDQAAHREYEAARQNANPVDLSGTIANIDATLAPGATQIMRPQSGLASDTIEAALEGVRRRLTDNRSMLTDFTAVQRVRGDLADQVQQAVNRGQGNRARLLGGVLREMDRAMEQASPGYLQANRNYETASRNIEAIGEGRTAATRGRFENTVPAFQALPREGQQGFRAGYVDPLIEQVQGAPVGVNKARQFTSDAFNREAQTVAPYAAPMQRRLARENTMFETRQHAMGGSRTADNLADAEAMGVDPSFIGHVLTGNIAGALRSAMGSVSNGLTGNTPAVRRAVGDILLARGVQPGQFQQILDRTIAQITEVQRRALIAKRTLAGTLATGANQVMAPSPPASPLARAIAAQP